MTAGTIQRQYGGIGLDVFTEKAAYRRGFTLIGNHLALDSNTRICAELANLGGEIYCQYRVFKNRGREHILIS